MKLLFFNLSTSSNITNLSIDYLKKWFTASKISANTILTSSLNARRFRVPK